MPRQISNAGASLSLSASASSSATKTTAAGTTATATAKKAFLLAAVCASLSSNQHAADAFAVPPLLSSARRSSSSFWKAPSSSSSSSTAVVVSSSPNDDREYFFTAPTSQRQRQLSNNKNYNNNNGAIDTTATAKTFAKRSNSNTIKSAEQSELERMGVADRAHRDNDDIDPEFLESITTQASSVPQTTLSVLSSSTPAATPAAPPTAVAAAVPMNVDGNGTGALMNRSHAAGGAHAPLMVTSYNPRDYPIDSGRDGMHAPKISTTKQPLSRSNDDIVDPTRPGVRLVRYKVQSQQQQQQQQQQPSQGPTRSETNLVLASALVKNNNSNSNNANANTNTNNNNNNNNNNNQDGTQSRTLAARPNHKPRRILIKKPKTPPATTITTPTTTAIARYSYNGPDIDSTTDHDGMETPAVQQKRNRMLKLRTANLVRYNGASQQQRLETPAAPADHSNSNSNSNTTTEQPQPPTETDTKQKKAQKDGGRKTLADDVGYANRYTGLTDFTLAKKTGLAVNKPISLWVERDKFL